GRKTAVAVSGVCGTADAGSGSRDQGARALHQHARLPWRAGQRLFANRRRQAAGLLRPAAILAVLGGGREDRPALLSAPAQSAAGRLHDLRWASVADGPDLGVRTG